MPPKRSKRRNPVRPQRKRTRRTRPKRGWQALATRWKNLLKRFQRKPTRGRRKSSSKRKSQQKWLGTAVRWGMIAGVWGVIGVIAVLFWFAMDLATLAPTTARPVSRQVTILAADGTPLHRYGSPKGDVIAAEDMPPQMIHALLSIEDRRFYDHFGLDPVGIARALVTNLREGRVVQGGSTLTQQLAKNLFLTHERSYTRKIQEVLLALRLEHTLSKDEILTLYLNTVYFGEGAYGVDAAARYYFGHSVRTVSVAEAAFLAGLLKAPSRYGNNPEQGLERSRVVLEAMRREGYITALPQRAVVNTQTEAGTDPHMARYFTAWIRGQVGSHTRSRNDLVVHTTLDAALQRHAATLARDLPFDARGKAQLQTAVITLDDDGAVRAMVGGRNYATSQFNRVTQARRQPGSAFKPVVYAAALESGFGPRSRITDEPLTVAGWSPRNFDGRYRGTVTLEQALAESINTASVRLAMDVGVPAIHTMADRLGITAPLPRDYSLALGSGAVSPLELTEAYLTLSTGRRYPAYGLERIETQDGETLYRRLSLRPQPVLKSRTVRDMHAMLKSVIDHGTGQRADLRVSAGGKTGTSQNYRDAWFVGMARNRVTGVWVGHDDNSPMQGITGGQLPAELWQAVMQEAVQTPTTRAPARTRRRSPLSTIGNVWRSIRGE